MQILHKTTINEFPKTYKTYTLFGVPVFKKEKSPIKRKYIFCGLKFTKTRKHPLLPTPANEPHAENFANLKDGLLDLPTIKAIIASPEIDIVSFDIFDTLLQRPCLAPTDIFHLVDAKLKQTDTIDFLKYRLPAEQELNNPHANLKEIYRHIQKRHKLTDKTIAKMYKAELEAERRLLFRREDVYQLYEYALKCGKRVIAVSDMYLPSRFLKSTLKAKGYSNIAAVYVSNEYQKRKDSGALYSTVAAAEHTPPQRILHIGDNKQSDYDNAVRQNLTAVYYPSVKDILFAPDKIHRQIFPPQVSADPMARLVLGWCLQHYYTDMSAMKNQPAVFENLTALATIGLTPLLFHIAQRIAFGQTIQSRYPDVLFASRDGYLPQISYELMRPYVPNLKPSRYVYAGRRAYFSATVTDFAAYAETLNVDGTAPYTIKNLLEAHISDKKLIKKILTSLTAKEKALDFTTHKNEIIKILHRHTTALSQYLQTHRRHAAAYYASLATDTPARRIIFDCGYSGSVSNALSPLLKTPVDKIYLWETKKNQQLDKKNKTKTFVLMKNPQLFSGHNILCEELFSPLEGGCIGFSETGAPLFEKCDFPPEMRQTLPTIQKAAIKALKTLLKDFTPWLPYMRITDTRALNAPLAYAFSRSPYAETELLAPINFPDPSYIATPENLSYKLQKTLHAGNIFTGTGFNNPLNQLAAPLAPVPQNLKIGIHCHLYNTALAQELLSYLKDFPAPFELILTICAKSKAPALKNIFTPQTIPNLQKLIIYTVPNRGRDVAPWLIATRPLQSNYDLICHIHGKESTHFSFGSDWRNYLFKNLISKEAAANVLNLFATEKKLGVIFPDIFPKLREFHIVHHITPEGMFGEEATINRLLKRMHINHRLMRSELFFSMGTMMWYRPQALTPLFELKLKATDFPPEPIGVGGTIAHAIERLPTVVCHATGFAAKTHTLR